MKNTLNFKIKMGDKSDTGKSIRDGEKGSASGKKGI